MAAGQFHLILCGVRSNGLFPIFFMSKKKKKNMKIRIYFFPCQAVVRCDNFFFKIVEMTNLLLKYNIFNDLPLMLLLDFPVRFL